MIKFKYSIINIITHDDFLVYVGEKKKMICLKYKNRDILCFRKSLLISFLYSTLIAIILISTDKLYAMNNKFFLFEFTFGEIKRVIFIVFIISMISNRKIRLLSIFILLLFSFLQFVHYEYFGKNIGAIEFYLFFTDLHEVFLTLGTMLWMMFIPFMITFTAFCLIYFIDYKLGSRAFKYKYGLSMLLLVILINATIVFYITNIKKDGFGHGNGNWIYTLNNRYSARNFFLSLNYFTVGIIPKKFFYDTPTFSTLEKPKLVYKENNRTIILIVGESLRYDLSTLHDNKLTPKLQSLKTDSNFFYKKIYSGGTMTKLSVATLVNRLKYPSSLSQIQKEDNCIFKLAKQNNFGTYFISAQDNKALGDMRDLMCPKYIDKIIPREMFKSYIVPIGYDEDMKRVLEKLNIVNRNNLIVMEQRGSHAPYEIEYPKEFDKYSPYENTVLYTDHTLYDLIKYIKENSSREFFIFFASDHGELLGENGKNGHGILEKNVYEVPLMLYTNSKQKDIKKEFDNIKSHYDLSNYIISLLGYKVDLNIGGDREIYIMNADLDGFSGYGRIKIINNQESQIEKFNE